MLREIPFFAVMLLVWIWPLLLALGLISLINKALAKPKAPPRVDTPEEATARVMRVRAMLAQAEESRLAHQNCASRS
jgi:hypothetical protein